MSCSLHGPANLALTHRCAATFPAREPRPCSGRPGAIKSGFCRPEVGLSPGVMVGGRAGLGCGRHAAREAIEICRSTGPGQVTCLSVQRRQQGGVFGGRGRRHGTAPTRRKWRDPNRKSAAPPRRGQSTRRRFGQVWNEASVRHELSRSRSAILVFFFAG